MRLSQAGFEFRDGQSGTLVYMGRRCIGQIITMKEPNGRYCFRLGCDTRKQPRTYRGRIRAAKALQIIDDLKRKASREHWEPETLIVRAWDDKPETAP